MIDETLLRQIELLNQRHVLQFWDDLSPVEQTAFADQLAKVDWSLIEDYRSGLSNLCSRAPVQTERISPPAHFVRQPKTDADLSDWKRAREIGEQVLREGKIAAVLLAGGQGTRLGFAFPKGMYPIGAVSGKSLFGILAEQVVALTERFGHAIPYLIMTSEDTHEETVSFFEVNRFFGLDRNDLYFFLQGKSPSVDAQTGKLLLAAKGSLRSNPDGHGGLLAALLKAGLFDELKNRGVEYLFSHQVDNPLAKVCDPEFIGMHVLHNSDVSTKVVAKTAPNEKVGIAVDLNGHTAIIEYSDLPETLANETDENGELRYWAGSTAIHILTRSFMESVATSRKGLPWHRAIKKVPYIDERGDLVSPLIENGVKFERFLFDVLPLAKTALIFEAIRAEDFAPLKNQSGDYSPDYVRQQMIRLAVKWLREAGVTVPEGAIVEISPRLAISPKDLKTRTIELAQLKFDVPVYLSPTEDSVPSKRQEFITNNQKSTSQKMIDPLVFDSFYRPQIWGGRALSTLLGRSLPDDRPFGEAWDVSPQPLHVSRIAEGPFVGQDLNEVWKSLGKGTFKGTEFPLLIKWLECRELLSLQVHPDNKMAQRVLCQPYGKSEAWVVVAVEPTARVYAGLKAGMTREIVTRHIEQGTLAECLHSFVPRVGDCISLPAGTIHAAGGGLVIAEVQQSSDATFRLYDWDRPGLDGLPRPLQIELALEATDWNQGPVSAVKPIEIPSHQPGLRAEQLVDGNGFRLERYIINQTMTSLHENELTIWMVLDGNGVLSSSETGYRRKFNKGSTVVVPPDAKSLTWSTSSTDHALTLLCARLRHHCD